jgi:hypothetical protein
MRAGILDVGIWNPAEHFTTLCQHFFRAGVEICKTSIDTPAVPTRGEIRWTIFLYSAFSSSASSFRPEALLYLGILGDKTGICCLSIDEAKYGFHLRRFLGISTINKDFRSRSLRRHCSLRVSERRRKYVRQASRPALPQARAHGHGGEGAGSISGVLNRNFREERTDGSSSTTKTKEAAVMRDSRQLLAA